MNNRLKKLFKIGGVVSIALLLAATVVSTYRGIESNKKDISLESYGVIQDIRISENHGTPSFLLDSSWQYLGLYGYNIKSVVVKNDSISKPKGESIMSVFRKNQMGEYELFLEVKPRKVEYK